MKKNIFLLFLLTSFATMFGQNANVYITDVNGAPVTGPEDGLTITDAITLVESHFTIINGTAFIFGLTVGAAYNYSALPPACFANQTASTGNFILAPRGADFSWPIINLNPFLGGETNTVELTVKTDGISGNVPGQVAKLVRVTGLNSFVEATGTNNNDGTWTFSNVPFGRWNVQVDNPCVETKRSDLGNEPIIVGCPISSPVTYTFNVDTDEEPQGEMNITTGVGSQIPLTDCTANYPMQIYGGNKIVDNTEYTISYTVGGVNRTTVATSYPTFNSPPQNSNNHNRIDFIPLGTPGSILTLNSLTPVVGTCPAIIAVGVTEEIVGPPLGYVSINPGTAGFGSPIASGTLTNVDTQAVIIGEVSGFSPNIDFYNVPEGNYFATIQLLDCEADKTINDIVVDCDGIKAGFITYSFVAEAGDLQISVTDGTSDILDATIHVYNDDGYDVTIEESTSGDYLFENVPYGEVTYEVSKEGKTTVTETVMIECKPENLTTASVVLTPALGVSVSDMLTLHAYSYPNPFTNDFGINVVSISQDKIQYKVYDMIGRLVEHRDIEVSDLQTTRIGNNYNAGIYNVVLSQGDYIKTLRVIKR